MCLCCYWCHHCTCQQCSSCLVCSSFLIVISLFNVQWSTCASLSAANMLLLLCSLLLYYKVVYCAVKHSLLLGVLRKIARHSMNLDQRCCHFHWQDQGHEPETNHQKSHNSSSSSSSSHTQPSLQQAIRGSSAEAQLEIKPNHGQFRVYHDCGCYMQFYFLSCCSANVNKIMCTHVNSNALLCWRPHKISSFVLYQHRYRALFRLQ